MNLIWICHWSCGKEEVECLEYCEAEICALKRACAKIQQHIHKNWKLNLKQSANEAYNINQYISKTEYYEAINLFMFSAFNDSPFEAHVYVYNEFVYSDDNNFAVQPEIFDDSCFPGRNK